VRGGEGGNRWRWREGGVGGGEGGGWRWRKRWREDDKVKEVVKEVEKEVEGGGGRCRRKRRTNLEREWSRRFVGRGRPSLSSRGSPLLR